jgi:chemotaxis protein CheZ
MSESAHQPDAGGPVAEVHTKIGLLTRQLHDSLKELGYADRLRGAADELPDAQSRLTYIARLTGEAAEKVLNRVDQAKAQHDYIAQETQRMVADLIKDPVRAVASGWVLNFVHEVERVTKEADVHLTEIMMAQDFHDLTGQVIARVVNLASNIEKQLVQLLIQTAPGGAGGEPEPGADASPAQGKEPEGLQGPVVDPNARTDVVTSQSDVDDLLASLGF